MKELIKKFYNYIEPSFRGIGILSFAFLFNMYYIKFITPDGDYDGRGELFVILFHYINKLGGKFLGIGIFVLIGIFVIIHDYHKKFGKKGNES